MKVRWYSAFPVALAALGAVVMADRAEAAACLTSDVSLTIGGTLYNPTSCADNVVQGGGPTAETSSLNTQLGTTGFVYLDKSDDPSSPTGIGGVAFEVTATTTDDTGTWTVTWTDVAGLPNLPLIIDFEVGLFGGNNGSGYLFDNVLLPINPNTGTGTFDINFLNGSGKNQPNLSHLLLAGANAESPPPPITDVPEPSSLVIFGSALLGLGWFNRRRKRI
jgi:hypothetical protein